MQLQSTSNKLNGANATVAAVAIGVTLLASISHGQGIADHIAGVLVALSWSAALRRWL